MKDLPKLKKDKKIKVIKKENNICEECKKEDKSVFQNLIAPLIDFQNSALQENVWQSVGQVPWQERFRNIFMPSKW